MNKEIIKAAIKDGTLRKYDLTQALAGDKVLGCAPGEVLAVYGEYVIIGWDLGDRKSVGVHGMRDTYHGIYLAPLCWVEDKPVYKGDTLFSKDGDKVTIEAFERGVIITTPGQVVGETQWTADYLSWTDPTILFEVEGKPVRKGDVLYGTWLHSNLNGYEITGKNDKGCPKWCGGVLTDKPEKLTWTKPVPTITINGHDVPAPEREPLPNGTMYYVPDLFDGGADAYYWWGGGGAEHHFLDSGLIHLTEVAATAHAQALISLSKS